MAERCESVCCFGWSFPVGFEFSLKKESNFAAKRTSFAAELFSFAALLFSFAVTLFLFVAELGRFLDFCLVSWRN